MENELEELRGVSAKQEETERKLGEVAESTAKLRDEVLQLKRELEAEYERFQAERRAEG